jgi:RecA-family ATPase
MIRGKATGASTTSGTATGYVDDTDFFDLDSLMQFDRTNDPNCLIGNRWICRGGSLILQGDTGMGKSSFILQAAMSWALGKSFFGIKPKGPLKIVLIQAENDAGDIAEPFQDIVKYVLQLKPDKIEPLKQNLIIGRQSAKAGAERFAAYVRAIIMRYQPDMVIVDPLLSYFGAAIYDQEAASMFFRNNLQPIQNETGVVFAFVHHVGKPPKANEQRQGPAHYLGLGSSDIMNWAREIVTMTHCGDGVYKVEFGKRADRSGVVNSAGEQVNEIFVRRAARGMRYWSLAENINSAQDAKDAAERRKREKIQAFIMRWETVTLGQLKQHASEFGYGENSVKAAADMLVADLQGSEQPIFRFTHTIAGQSGQKPTIYSIYPKPDESVRVVVPVIGQMQLIPERKDWDN